MSTKRTLHVQPCCCTLLLFRWSTGRFAREPLPDPLKDASGAIVASATVSIVNQETSIKASAVTTDSGQFTFPYLPAGPYTVTVTAQGFVAFKESGVNLATAQTVRVDATLKVSGVETAVEVQGQAATVQTDSTSVSSSIEAKVIDAIPNITQNPLYYAMLQNGVQPRNETAASTSLNSFGIGVAGRAWPRSI